MKIGVVGCGIVGGITIEILKDHHKLYPYDKYKSGMVRGVELVSIDLVVENSKVIFVSVPTPMKVSGEMDLSSIYSTVEEIEMLHNLNRSNRKMIICIRSTAVSGTTDGLEKKFGNENLKFAFQPEFLTEANYIEDAKHPDRIIIGANERETALAIKKVYGEAGFFLNGRIQCLITDLKTSEMIKYASNCFLAAKVSFANEIYNICKHLNIEYNTVKQALLMDRRIGKSHLNVPGPDLCFGFGKKCFPKDLNALIYLSREHGYNPRLLEEVWETNLKVRKNRDWEKIPGATQKKGYSNAKKTD